jgi:hypothetical protein
MGGGAILRQCPVCLSDSIVGHGRRRKQAHDENHDWIPIRRGLCNLCGKTFTFLPPFSPPYCHYSLIARSQSLRRYFVEAVAGKPPRLRLKIPIAWRIPPPCADGCRAALLNRAPRLSITGFDCCDDRGRCEMRPLQGCPARSAGKGWSEWSERPFPRTPFSARAKRLPPTWTHGLEETIGYDAETRQFSPSSPLDVVDDRRFRPCEERWDCRHAWVFQRSCGAIRVTCRRGAVS